MPIIAKNFYMIRHGQTEANAARIMAGSLDSPLTDLGRTQADIARKIVENLEVKPDIIVHSHLSRARETAEIINKNLDTPLMEDSDFAEMHAGEWEGVSYEICDQMFHDWVDPPSGETVDEFFTRIKRAKNKVLATQHKIPLIVCHGGVFRAFAKFYEIDTWGVRNCDLHHFAPNENNKKFPWDIYRILENGAKNKFLKADSFYDPQNRPVELFGK